MKKKIWIISEFYYPIVTSTGYYITEIAEYLSEKGMDVNVICTGAKYNETSDFTFKSKEVHNGVKIHRVKVGDIDKNNFIKRTFRLLTASFSLFFKAIHNIQKGDELLVVTNPAFFLLFVPLIKSIKKTSYKLLVHDIFPENLAAIGQISPSSSIYKIIKSVFDKAYSKADICISIGRDMTAVINRKTNYITKTVLIPNWADTIDVFPLEKEKTKLYKQSFSNESFIFQFAGNLGHAQGLDNILESIQLLNNPDIHFLFVGGGAKYQTIKTFSQKYPNVVILGYQDRSQQNDFLNACDVAIVTLSDGMYGLGVPSKSYNIMAAGKPILMVGDDTSEIALCIKEYGLGWVVKPNDPEKLKEAIEEIYTNREKLSAIKNNARNTAEQIFAKEYILKRYFDLFNDESHV